jgi:hypothetical protein
MADAVVTSFDKEYWNEYGASFLGSLIELAKWNQHTVVIDFGLPYKVKWRLKQCGVTMTHGIEKYGPEIDRFITFGRYARLEQDYERYAYWEADVYFQAPIDGAWTDKIGYTLERNEYNQIIRPSTGFLSGPCELLGHFADFMEFAASRGETDKSAMTAFVRCFPDLVQKMPETWNCNALGTMQWKQGYHLGKEIVKVVHPSGPAKRLQEGREYLFKEKYKDVYDFWHNYIIMGNNTSARGLLKKSSKHLVLKNRD